MTCACLSLVSAYFFLSFTLLPHTNHAHRVGPVLHRSCALAGGMYKSMRENSILLGTPRKMSDFLAHLSITYYKRSKLISYRSLIEISNSRAATSTQPPPRLHLGKT